MVYLLCVSQLFSPESKMSVLENVIGKGAHKYFNLLAGEQSCIGDNPFIIWTGVKARKHHCNNSVLHFFDCHPGSHLGLPPFWNQCWIVNGWKAPQPGIFSLKNQSIQNNHFNTLMTAWSSHILRKPSTVLDLFTEAYQTLSFSQ